MATVSSTFGIIDRFTRPMQLFVNKISAATIAAERLKRVVEAPINMSLNTAGVESGLAALRSRIAGSGGTSAIEVVLNVGDISQKIAQIQQRIRSGLTSAAIDVTINGAAAIASASSLRARLDHILSLPMQITLNTATIIGDISSLRTRIIAQIGVIEAEIRLTLPSTLTDMLTSLRALVLRLVRAVQLLRRSLNPPPIPPIPPPPIPPVPGAGAGAGDTGGLLSNLKGIAAAYLSIAGAQKLVGATIGGAMQQQKMMDMFIARTGDAEVGTAMFDKFKAEALAAGQDVNEALKGTLSFFSTTQNTDQLSQLNGLAARMAAFDSAGNGIEGAAFALKEAMSGDIVSLAERFNMSKADIRGFKIDELGKAGDMDGFIKAFNQLLEKQKMGEEAFKTMLASPAKQAETLGNNIKSAMADAGGAAVAALLPLISMLNEAFQAGKFQPFFDGLSMGLAWVTEQVVWLVENAMWLSGVISDNWPVIEPIIWGIVGAFTAWKLITTAVSAGLAIQSGIQAVMGASAMFATGATMAQTAAQWGLNAALMANPITWIILAIVAFIAVIVLLVKYIINLWKTNDEFAAGFMRVWNSILNFFDTIPAYFWQLVEWIMQAFVWWAGSIGKIYDTVFNGILEGINKVLDVINKVTGSAYEIQAKFNIEDIANKMLDFAGEKKNAAYESAVSKAAEREQKVVDMLDNRAQNRAEKEAAKETKVNNDDVLSKWNSGAGASKSLGNIDEVGEVGKINDSVDISTEDLKTMRELAEMKNIQNFVTLTPSVSVTTGPVTNGADMDSIISKIDTYMSETIASSAKGVYE